MPPKGPYLNGNRYWANIPGLGRRPLIPQGDKLATDDYDTAVQIHANWLKRIREETLQREMGIKVQKNIAPGAYAIEHIKRRAQKKREKRKLRADEPLPASDLELLEKSRDSIMLCLGHKAVAGFTTLRQWDEDAVKVIAHWLKHEARTRNGDNRTPSKRAKKKQTGEQSGKPTRKKSPQPGPKGKLLKPATVRRIMMELSAMFTAAVRDKYMDSNPIPGHPDLPKVDRKTALKPSEYNTREEVRRLLNATRYSSRNPWAVEQVWTLYYTGGRLSETMGMLMSDFNFKEDLITMRGTKGDPSAAVRTLPMWAPHKRVMEESVRLRPRNPNGLAFPAPGTEHLPLAQQVAMKRLSGTLRSAALRAGVSKHIHPHIARHSYASARQKMEWADSHGRTHRVSNAEIAAEIGHTTEAMVRDVYGHLVNPGPDVVPGGEIQSGLDYYADDPIPYMRAYWRERNRLARRRERHEARQAQRRLRQQH